MFSIITVLNFTQPSNKARLILPILGGKEIQNQVEVLNNYLLDVQRSKATLSNVKIEENMDETLISLGSGVLMKAKPLESDKVYYNVGAGVIVTKKIDEAIDDLDSRVEEIQTKMTGLSDQLQQVYQQMQQLEQQGQAIAMQLQGGGKPSTDR